MSMLRMLCEEYEKSDCRDLSSRQLEKLMDGLKVVHSEEITSAKSGKTYIDLLRKFREAVAENDKLHGENYPQLLKSLLSVGEDGLYSNSLRFIFELIQNVDDCDFLNSEDCKLDMYFDFNHNEIVLKYNEVGFTPYNVFAITGIAEAAKNVSVSKNEIGEKGIGFKSVFGVADKVLIRSGWFSFELYKENFTIPMASYITLDYCAGTEMTLHVSDSTRKIYNQIKDQYCRKEALFTRNPLLFLNKLTSLRLYNNASCRSMEFYVSSKGANTSSGITREDGVKIAVNLRDHSDGFDKATVEEITCVRYSYPVVLSTDACKSRYGNDTKVGSNGGKQMSLQAIVPSIEDCEKVGSGGLYSFLPTQLAFTVPIVCHAPFKLDASREFVDPQNENLWFEETSKHLADLLDYVFSDWCKTAKSDIIRYIPEASESLFEKNNGKEICLSKQSVFQGGHYLQLPIFITSEGTFKSAKSIFCFPPIENVENPQHVTQLLSISKSLFLPPKMLNIGKFNITEEKNINSRLFQQAMLDAAKTQDCLEYLDAVGYEYSDNNFPKDKKIEISVNQVECIFKHRRLADIMVKIADVAIKTKKRHIFSITGVSKTSISNVLYDNFELSETPRFVESYLKNCGQGCFCMDIEESCFLPCDNGIVLSKANPVASFASFCYQMDPQGTFAIRIRLKEASKQIDKCVEQNTGTAVDYLRDLYNIRRTVQDSLGKNGYKSYIDLILKSGTNRERFIQELLQNADDCIYPAGILPSFTLMQNKEHIIIEYNEVGFTRENIRAITAIGESTKNRLLNGDLHSIGEKGVGFKTVFASASEVKIYSGEFNFSLSAKEPTIPRLIQPSEKNFVGTKMEITLKDKIHIPTYSEKDILELCLCLRKLRRMKFGTSTVSIDDTDICRTITINKKTYTYEKYTHSFDVTNEEALLERENSSRKISPHQKIICYVPERTTATDYALYVGLPTKHKIHIPIIIDAPFELTTSRETIEEDCNIWNDIILLEMYNAIIKVMHERKNTDRANVLRFARFSRRFTGNQSSAYFNDITDSKYLNSYDYLSRLKKEHILPTFNKTEFAAVIDNLSFRYPEAASWLLADLLTGNDVTIDPALVIDTTIDVSSKEQKERIEAVFNALSCSYADFSMVFPLIEKYAEEYIGQEEFRNKLYEYLQTTPEKYHKKIAQLRIIPVFGRVGGVQYITWVEDGIFVKKAATSSPKTYWILNEKYLEKSMCEKMLGININEMNVEWERNKYNEDLSIIIQTKDITCIYEYLIHEYRNYNLEINKSVGVLFSLKEDIPLKNQLGEIVKAELFLCDQPVGYFSTTMLQKITVHSECADFARFMKLKELNGIHYEDIIYDKGLTADDVEALKDDYFLNSEEILRNFYREGYLSDKLLSEYEINYLMVSRVPDTNVYYEFPEASVGNREQLRAHINKQWSSRMSIITVKEERTVQKVQSNDGQVFSFDSKEARDRTMSIYTPEEVHNYCFCQMCQQVKPYMLIEVNNIETQPKYYFPQLRVALCLECSKRYELLRNNKSIYTAFMEAIRSTNITNESKIEIIFGREDTIAFTAKHLAEIQEIINYYK